MRHGHHVAEVPTDSCTAACYHSSAPGLPRVTSAQLVISRGGPIMFKTSSFPTPRSALARSAAAGAAIAAVLAVLGGTAISAQDKYTLKVPNGLAFSEFRGFENCSTAA